MSNTKSFKISKNVIWQAYQKVKQNKGAAGVDNQSIDKFEKDLKNNLYKLWNRMSSGSYFPPPVRIIEIAKKDGGMRTLGIGTVTDRIAQTAIKMLLEPRIDPYFHRDSYGYRPGKSAHEAIEKVRKRGWRFNWVLDLDIEKFFDTLNRELLMKAIRKHTNCKWILLYIERWLETSEQNPDGSLNKKDQGTIQGAVISPLLANLFLHYAFDEWMSRNYPKIPFARFADDIVIHCKTEKECLEILHAVNIRLRECQLNLHPRKTKVVYCKDNKRKSNHPNICFDFLGYTFRPRKCRNNQQGKCFTGFNPAVSQSASKKMRQKIRRWRLQLRNKLSLKEISELYNTALRGWINYFSKFYSTAIRSVLQYFNRKLTLWASKKYKLSIKRAQKWLKEIAKRDSKLFAHWQLGILI